jgi:RNA binding exosome subunit
MSEWLKETGCKLVSESLRWFESSSTQTFDLMHESAQGKVGNRSNLFTGEVAKKEKADQNFPRVKKILRNPENRESP